MFKTVVVGADDSTTARQAVAVAAEIAQNSGGTLHLVTAADAKSIRASDLPAEFRHTASANPADTILSGLSMIAKEHGLEAVIHPTKGSPAEAILRIAEQEHADLIVVGNVGMKGMKRVLGSVPNSIAHAAPCSVLIVDTRPEA